MQINFLDKVFTCENEVAAVEGIFDQINQLLTESNQQISSFEIDGIEIVQDYGEYIVANLADIKTIVVKIKTLAELLADSLLSIQEYLIRAIPAIEGMVNEFLRGVTQDTWNQFAQLMDGLQYMINTLNAASQHPQWYSNAAQLAAVKEKLLTQVVMLQEAVECQDRVRISDVLLYEIVPSFLLLKKEISISTGIEKVQ